VYILDSSAIAVILRRLKEKSIDVIKDGITLDLAKYELGNVIWKECVLKGTITFEEAINRAENLARILDIMRIEEIESDEDFKGVMRLATKLGLTFYDASYLHVAKQTRSELVTEDTELYEKAKQVGVKSMTVSELLREFGVC